MTGPDRVKTDCVHLETHAEVQDFSFGAGGYETRPAYSCTRHLINLHGCPAECPHYRPQSG